jgi:hypothetical protein
MVEISELEEEYEYTIEIDEGSEYVHLYFANVVDFQSPSVVRFDPTYEVGNATERKLENQTMIIPYDKVIRIVKRKEPD